VSKAFGIGLGVAALLIVVYIWALYVNTKVNHLAAAGWIANVRVQSLQPEETLMVIDFGLVNDSDVQLVAATIDPWIVTRDGKELHGSLFASDDMAKTFSFYPSLGPMLYPPLPLRGAIDGHKTVKLMVGVEFDVPAEVVETRKSTTLRIEDVSGPSVELTAR
jgi:hypothetical protein